MEQRMKRTLVGCVAALMSLMVLAQAADKKMSGGTEQVVAALEQKWTEDGKASNADAVAPLLAEKYVNTGSDGKTIGKAETLAHTKAAKWEVNEISDVKVTVFGNTAIATGNWAGKGLDENGMPIDTHERFTDTWMKMPSGHWQCIASHGSTIKM
jgi:ketosteroid isomerase-like protein